MANTFIKISTVTVSAGGSSTIDFTSIPQTYTDLKLILCNRSSNTGTVDGSPIYFNSDTTSGNYTYRRVLGDGASVASATVNGLVLPGSSATANAFANSEIYIPNYTGSNNKTMSIDSVTETNAVDGYAGLTAGRWSGTAAITSIRIQNVGGTFVQYSTATLYGIKSS
jgi:hypothetical protein